MPMGVFPAPTVKAGLPAFSLYLASAPKAPIAGKPSKILAAFAIGVITLPVPVPQTCDPPMVVCKARLLLKTVLAAFGKKNNYNCLQETH